MKQVLMLAGDYTEDYEVMAPHQTLQVAGVGADVVCPDKEAGGTIRTAIHDFEGDQTHFERLGRNFVLDASFQYLKLGQYNGLLLIDGRAPGYPRLNPRVLDMVHYFMDLRRPVAAICRGVQILTAAGVLKGEQVTVYSVVCPEVLVAGNVFTEGEPHKTVICDSLVISLAWPENVEILRGSPKLSGVAALQ